MPFSSRPFSSTPFSGRRASSLGFTVSPNSSHATGAVAITATGIGTTWGSSNPFTVSSGPGSISGYSNPGPNPLSATFTLNVTAVSSTPIVISDGVYTCVFSAAAITPRAPTSINAVNNGNGTVSISFTPPVDNGGAAITGYSATWSGGQNNGGTSSPILLSGVALGVAGNATVHATNSAGNGIESAPSNTITPASSNVVSILIRAPYLATDAIGTKQAQLYTIVGGVLAPIGSLLTTGFSAIPNVNNGWNLLLTVTPNGANGDFTGIAVFNNINGTDSAPVEVYSPPNAVPTILPICKIAPFRLVDTIVAPGYQLYDAAGSTIGAHITSGIFPIPGVVNGYVTRVVLTADQSGGFQGTMVWDTG